MVKRMIHFCRITLSASPVFFALNMLALLIIALGQMGIQYSFKVATDTILMAQESGMISYTIALPILFFFLMICIGGNTGNFEEMMTTAFSHKARRIFAKYFLNKSYESKQDVFYDSKFYDQYAFVKNNIENTSNVAITIFNKLSMAVFRMALAIGAISYFNPLIVVYMGILSLVMIAINNYVVKRRVALRESYINDERQARYYEELLASRAHSKELRIYNLRARFMKKWENAYKGYMEAKYAFEVKATWLSSISELLRIVISSGLTLYFLYLVSQGRLGVGAFVFLNGLLMTLSNAINSIINVLTKDLAENDQYIQRYEQFTGRSTLKSLKAVDQYTLEKEKQEPFETLEFKNVCYRYPNASKYAIKNLSFTVHKGEVISLLGYNGSGKSTLSKLMCGLLEDYEGQILLNGKELRTFPREALYRYFGIGFQDFSRYSISLRDNIAVGMIEVFDDELKVQKAIQKGHLMSMIDKLPDGLETILGKEYSEKGQDLSGGQWQRIILGRAYMGEPDMLILDEPTAAIDPLEEMRMLHQFRELVEGKTALLISHRIGFARMADRIMMMEEGELVEEGDHNELIGRGGTYSKLFLAQQELYQEEVCYG